MMRVTDAAKKCGISKTLVYKCIRKGTCKYTHIGYLYFVDENDLKKIKNPAENVFSKFSPERVKMIGLNIRDARWVLGMTSAEFAKAVGVSRDVIYRVENGIRMSVRTREKIKEFLKNASKQG